MSYAYLLLFVGCLACSFLFSGMEAGLLALSRMRIRRWMHEGNRRAKVLHEFLENPEAFLWTILVGNTISNIIVVSLAVIALYSWLLPWPAAFVPAVVLGAILFYAFCDLLPKMLFRLFPNRLCILLATPFRLVHLLLRPVVSLFERVSRLFGGRQYTGLLFGNRHELRLLLQEPDPSLTQEERVMIGRVLDLQSLQIRHITTPMPKAVSVLGSQRVGQLLEDYQRHGYSRLPLWDRSGPRRRLLGLVNVKSILYQEDVDPGRPAADFVQPALYLKHDLRLDQALRIMQSHRQRLAVVCGPQQQEIGIVSLQDILKAIFGDLSL